MTQVYLLMLDGDMTVHKSMLGAMMCYLRTWVANDSEFCQTIAQRIQDTDKPDNWKRRWLHFVTTGCPPMIRDFEDFLEVAEDVCFVYTLNLQE